MDRESVRTVVRVTLMALDPIVKRTRTQADDLMASILQANQERIVDAVVLILQQSDQPPTQEQVLAALQSVGIKV